MLFNADNIEFIRTIEAETVALTVTSPPYDSLRTYATEGDWTFERFKLLATELHRITIPGGVVVWNVCDQTINGSETGSSFRQALHFMDVGFNLADTMVYKKSNPGGARGSNKTYTQSFEYMFILSKGPIRTYNLIKDRPNKQPTRINYDGDRAFPTKPHGCRFNVWEYPTQTDNFATKHPAPMPYQMAVDHILTWSNPDDLVFDPFSGSGTTILAALMNNRRAMGVEISEDYHRLAVERLNVMGRPLAAGFSFGEEVELIRI